MRSLEMLKSEVPVLIENTAGGDNAVARRFDALARLWDAIGELDTAFELGFCFDTCTRTPPARTCPTPSSARSRSSGRSTCCT